MTEFVHHHVRLNGLAYHFVTAGSGPPILFLHGFPDLWIGWRPVMERMVEAGYMVIAPDMRGCGDTEAAAGSEQATAVDLLGDMIAVLDHLEIAKVAVVAHDWGAEVGWTIIRLRPDRFAALTALSVPCFPRGEVSALQVLKETAPPDLYMFYFLEEGLAEQELDENPREFLRRLFYTGWGGRSDDHVATMRLAANGRLSDALDEPPGAENMIGDEELDIYARAYTQSGFRGALNTYRSLQRNWELLAGWADRAITVPTFYIGGSRDIVLGFPGVREIIDAMPSMMPMPMPPVILEGVGHFIQIERPDDVARLLTNFLAQHHPSAS